MMKRTALLALVGLVALVFSACGSAAPTNTGLDARHSGQDGRSLADAIGQGSDPCSVSTTYFTYNSDSLTHQSRDALVATAQCIHIGYVMPIHLVGAADPRGTEEYNLALGERRAKSVRDYLVALGVDATRVTFSSLGEELASGTDEATWALDRHVMPQPVEVADGLSAPRAALK